MLTTATIKNPASILTSLEQAQCITNHERREKNLARKSAHQSCSHPGSGHLDQRELHLARRTRYLRRSVLTSPAAYRLLLRAHHRRQMTVHRLMARQSPPFIDHQQTTISFAK